MPWANERLAEEVNHPSEITKKEADRVWAIMEANALWHDDILEFRDLILKEGSASLLEEFDRVYKKLTERIEYIKTGESNNTSQSDSITGFFYLIVGFAIIFIPWFVGLKSFFN